MKSILKKLGWTSLVCTLVVSCSNPQKEAVKEKTNDHKFSQEIELNCKSGEIDEPINIWQWGRTDSYVICHNDADGKQIYIFDPQSLKVVQSFGNLGNGPEEYDMPDIIEYKDGFCIFNAGKCEIEFWKNGNKVSKKNVSPDIIPNMPALLNDSVIIYQDMSPVALSLNVVNLRTAEKIDSIEFVSDKLSQQDLDFVFNTDGKHLVTAKRAFDEVKIYEIDEYGKLYLKTSLLGTNPNEKGAFYADVKIVNDVIYLLNVNKADYANKSGYSVIESFDLEGNPLKSFKVNFIADKMLIFDNLSAVITSPFDDLIYTASLK